MNLSKNLLISLEILTVHKLRTLLSVTGIIVGVGAVVMMVSVGRGAESRIVGTIRNLGTNMLVVNAGQTRIVAGRERQVESVVTLMASDAEAIERDVESVVRAAPAVTDRVSTVWEGENFNTTVMGITPEGLGIREIGLERGRAFTDAEDRARRRVAVIGPTVAENLFPGTDPLGLRFRIGRVPFEVIGITAPKGTDITGQDLDDIIFVPLGTAQRRLLNIPHVQTIYVQAGSQQDLAAAEQEIAALLRDRHRLKPGDMDDFTIQNQATLLEAETEAARSLTVLTGSVAGISLLVGGVGILAVMLISVRERTSEIGLRRAVGAERKDIRNQFLIEAVLLSVGGGLLGIAGGVAAALGLSLLGYWDAVISWGAAGAGFGFSVTVGVLFGLYPAVRAARQEPVDALRAV